MKLIRLTLLLCLVVVTLPVLAEDPSTFDQRFAVVATDSSGYPGPIIPFQGPQFFEPLRTAWWYNYLPSQQSYYVPGLTLFWPGYQRLYMFWRAVSTTSDAAIQKYARDAKAADPNRTIWWAMSNEPNDLHQANQSGTSFAAIYLKHHKNLRIGDPTCKIMGAGILNWTWSSSNTPQTGKAWYEEFRNAWAANPTCVAYSQGVNGTNYPPQDAFSVHSYYLSGVPDNWRYCRDELIACHNDLQTYPETQGLKIWNTEWGSLFAPTLSQSADMMSGLGLWMRDQPWIDKWFLFITHNDKNGSWPNCNLFDDSGAINQLGKGYRDLSLLPINASFHHYPFSATWDTGTVYGRAGSTQSANVAEAFGAPGYSLSLTNGLAYTANSMRGRRFTPTSGYVYRLRFNYLTNYDNAYCYFAMDIPGQINKWAVDTNGVSTDYVDIDLSSDPAASVSLGLYIKKNLTYSDTTGNWRGVVSNLMLLTCPNPPVVTDEGFIVASADHLAASWTAPDGGQQPITEYEYAIGTSPKAVDLVGWTSTGAANSFSRDDLTLVDDAIYYISVRAKDSGGNWGAIGVSDGIRKLRYLGSSWQAKGRRRNTYCAVENVVVSGVFTDSVYVQEQSRCSGIRVMGASGLQPGDIVTIAGNVSVEGCEAMLRNPVTISAVHGPAPLPIGMSNKAMGGAGFGLQPTTIDYVDRSVEEGRWASGLSSVGLLGKTTGQVTYVDPSYGFYYIDDGSGLKDGSGQTGVRVLSGVGPAPAVGSGAIVTACVSCMNIGGNCARVLRPRSASDVQYTDVANWLLNPGFEGGSYSPWVFSGTGGGIRFGTWNTIKAHTGSYFFGSNGALVCYSGALYQTVDVPPGDYAASVRSVIFHSATTNPEVTKNRIGLDPTGGTDPNAPTVVWSDWDTTTGTAVTPWHLISTSAVSVTGGRCTVFLRYLQQDATRYHLNCFDDVQLVAE